MTTERGLPAGDQMPPIGIKAQNDEVLRISRRKMALPSTTKVALKSGMSTPPTREITPNGNNSYLSEPTQTRGKDGTVGASAGAAF